uniref:Translation initiation factor eIF2B subunit epsilon n=1 Tax=Heterorhabditis bacteriophora TaxID=37862 RepID=A0A1I7X9W7_HETBA
MSLKKPAKKEDDNLTAVLIVDTYDQRFFPFTKTIGPWCLQRVCNIPIIYYTLSWIRRTEIKRVILVASKKNEEFSEAIERASNLCFESLHVIICKNAMSVGDALRELDSRNLLTGEKTISRNKVNAMELLNHFLSDVVIRRDVVDSGIALCSLNISAQFSDNFDFQNRDDVIREILVNEEILMQNIHISVLPETEAAVSVTLLTIVMRLLREFVISMWQIANITSGSIPANAFNVSVGNNCSVANSVKMSCSSIGNDTKIGANTLLFNTIIGNNCVIGDYCTIQEAVIGNGVIILPGTKLSKRAIISAQVTYPTNFEYPVNSAVCAWGPGEDFEDTIKDKSVSGVHIWSLTGGSSFWNVDGSGDKILSSGSQDDENESGCEFESDSSEAYEMDNTVQFYEEVVESMERIQTLVFSDQQMHNLILEINSSKLAYNISMEDVAKNVFSAFLGLPGNEVLAGFKAVCIIKFIEFLYNLSVYVVFCNFQLASKWRLLFTNYYQPKKSQIQLLLAIEERFKNHPDEFGPKVAKMVHMLYDDLDILEEEAILEWADSLESELLRKHMKPIIDWLQQDSDEEESDN